MNTKSIVMKKYLFIFSVGFLLTFISCSKSNLYEEPKEEIEEEKELPFEIIPRDTISVDIDIYPD